MSFPTTWGASSKTTNEPAKGACLLMVASEYLYVMHVLRCSLAALDFKARFSSRGARNVANFFFVDAVLEKYKSIMHEVFPH